MRTMLQLLLCLLSIVDAQQLTGRIATVDGYPLDWLRSPQAATPTAAADYIPTPVPFRPLSMRIVYRMWPDFTGTELWNTLVVGGNGLNAVVVAKLISPDATDCTAAPYIATNGLRSKFGANGHQRLQQFVLPLTVGDQVGNPYLDFPYEHLMPWICVCAGDTQNDCPMTGTNAQGLPGNWIHTNLKYAPTQGCDGDNVNNQAVGSLGGNYLCEPRALLATPQVGFSEVGDNGAASRTSLLFLERTQRIKCCGWRDVGSTDLNGVALQKRYGVCVNPRLTNCCARNTAFQEPAGTFSPISGGIGKPYNKFREKCCYGGNVSALSQTLDATVIAPEPVIISYNDDWCPCLNTKPQAYCNQVVPSNGIANNCCAKTKYPELIAGYENQVWGKCFDGVNLKCCDTGDLYDPGSFQCCSINGIQSINTACPCGLDSHCGINQTCCQDASRPMFPPPYENRNLCNKYINYPTGTASYLGQPCTGQCIDSRFQICCNGHPCIDSYEVCCNSTCCNKFSQRCTMGYRPGSYGQPFNRKDFHIPYEVCTTVEGLTPFRATQVFFLPLCLLFATFVSLAATLFFAKRQSTLQPLSQYEKGMFTLSCLVILFAWPLFFHSLYKYGIVTVWAAFFTMLASLSQLRGLNIAAIVVNGILLIYLVDPFYGNEILTLAEDRTPPPFNSVHGATGVLHAISTQAMNGQKMCTDWYDYFQRDPNVEDRLRWDNPQKTSFGFCARGWHVTLLLFECITLVLVFLLFFASLITHIRNILFYKAQKTDEVVGWY